MAKTRRMPKQWARDEDKEAFWKRMLVEYASSGVSVAEFCRVRGLSSNSFNAWRRELLIRERERAATGRQDGISELPKFPDKVKDSRGRLIPSRVSKWLAEKQTEKPTEHTKTSSFIPLKLVEQPAPCEKSQPQNSAIEVVSPSGFTVRLNGDFDVANVKKLLNALEK